MKLVKSIFCFLKDLFNSEMGVKSFLTDYLKFRKFCHKRKENPADQLYLFMRNSEFREHLPASFNQEKYEPEIRKYFCHKCGETWEAPASIVCPDCAKEQEDVYYRGSD